MELFFDPATKSIPLDAGLVKGSHGAPAETAEQYGAVVVSGAGLIADRGLLRDRDVLEIAQSLMGTGQ